MTDATWLLLDRAGIILGLITGSITLLALLFGYLNRERVRRWFTRNRFPAIGGILAESTRYDGLVFTVSKRETPEWVLDQVNPMAVVFVASEQSRGVADEMKAGATNITHAFVVMIDEPDDPSDTRRAVRQSIERLTNLGCANIAVDVTGGKVPMSLGAFMAAEEAGKDSLYVSVSYDSQLNRPRVDTARMTVVSRPSNNTTTSG